MSKIGKHQLENNFFLNYTSETETVYFQKFSSEVKKSEAIQISTLAMDFPEGMSQKERKSIVSEWIEKLPELDNIRHLSIRHRVDEPYFDSICKMKHLESVFFWSCSVEDISKIAELRKLKSVHLGGFSKLKDISPLLRLDLLTHLSIEKGFKIENYEIIGEMKQLLALKLEGDSIAPKNLMLDSLKPFTQLQNLQHLDLSYASIKDKSYLELLHLKNLIRLDAMWRMKKEIRDKIKNDHPSLNSGFFTSYDFEKNEFYSDIEWWRDLKK